MIFLVPIFGTIILPVFIQPSEDNIGTIEKSNFKPVWEVLKALRSHDERLDEELEFYKNAQNTCDSKICKFYEQFEFLSSNSFHPIKITVSSFCCEF